MCNLLGFVNAKGCMKRLMKQMEGKTLVFIEHFRTPNYNQNCSKILALNQHH